MAISVKISDVIAAIINFLILYLLLTKIFYKPIVEFIDKRKISIKQAIEKAKNDKEEAEKYKNKNQQLLFNAKDDGKKIVGDYKKKAEKLYDEIVNDANKESQLIVQRAETEANREKEKALQDIKGQIVDISMMLSEKVLEEHIDEEEHKKLIDEFIAKVGI